MNVANNVLTSSRYRTRFRFEPATCIVSVALLTMQLAWTQSEKRASEAIPDSVQLVAGHSQPKAKSSAHAARHTGKPDYHREPESVDRASEP